MKPFLSFCFLLIINTSQAQNCENIFIITTDGYRWQELFTGADSSILMNPEYVKDTSTLKYLYWAATGEERRNKLMPFVWNFVSKKGQIWGNRAYENNVNVTNLYRFSYPGYSELLTGYADDAIFSNRPIFNSNTNLLNYLNTQLIYKDKIALFGSWELFTYIVGKNKSGIAVNCGYQPVDGDMLTLTEKLANSILELSNTELPTRSDILTFTLATEYIKKNHPKIVYISFGETDEFAHHGRYDDYLNQANLFDKFLAELWSQTQSDEFYKNKTTFFVTTDHGRGRKSKTWKQHGFLTSGSDQTWLIQLGPNILPLGELRKPAELKTVEFAQTIAAYLSQNFKTEHPVKPASASLLASTINE